MKHLLYVVIAIITAEVVVSADISRHSRSADQDSNPVFSDLRNSSSTVAGNVRIIGGASVQRGNLPWHVGIVADGKKFCSGALISSTWVLTAAHCIASYSVFNVIFGASQNISALSENGVLIEISTTKVVHSGFSNVTYRNDIALLKLETPIATTSYVAPIPLVNSTLASSVTVGSSLVISGWGIIANGSSVLSSSLKYLQVTVIDNAQCTLYFGDNITDSKMCTYKSSTESPCTHDDGDPVIMSVNKAWTLVGIVSGTAADCQSYPTAITRISSYLTWISANTDIPVS